MSSFETDPTELQRVRLSTTNGNGHVERPEFARSVYDRLGTIERGIADIHDILAAAALQRSETNSSLREMRGAILSALGAMVLILLVGFLCAGVYFFLG